MAEGEIKEVNTEIKHAEHNSRTNEENAEIIAKRKEKFFAFFKNKGLNWIYFVLLAVLIISVISVRTSNIPSLKDSTTGQYTLGPDLDPFLFLRYAKLIVEQGSLPKIDTMRYVPLGFNTNIENKAVPYGIAYLYKFLHIFNPNVSIEYAAIILPVIFFVLALVVFFLFVRKLFYKNKMNNLIALISTTLIAYIPSMLHRMTAGIPEKECIGIFFFFLTLMLFTYAINSDKLKKNLVYGILTGISTGLLANAWGGVNFIFLIVGLFGMIMLVLNKANKKIFTIYASWLLFTVIFALNSPMFPSLFSSFQNTLGLFCWFAFLLITINLFLRAKIEKILKIENKLPPVFATLIFGILIVMIAALIMFGPNYFVSTFNAVTNSLLHPMGTDRIALTVAENNQPYFDSWKSEFGLNFFWIFFMGSIFLFYEAIANLKIKNKILLIIGYAAMLFALIFSRYSGSSTLNGVSDLSKTLYFGGFILFAVLFVYVYFKSYYKDKEEFEKFASIDKNIILLFGWFLFSVISARGAMRLFMMLAPPAAILASNLVVGLPKRALKVKEELPKILFWCAAGFVILLLVLSFLSFAKSTSNEAKYTIPSYYNIQWQRAMSWVRAETPKDAVFSHWWDYGYWLQSIGERATVVDGGNSIGYWDHLIGRHVLTGQSESEALEFLYSHNVTHFLIDSTEIGKYTAYASIGSDVNNDRYSWIPTMVLDQSQTIETKNETMKAYVGGTALDQDFIWQGQLFPASKAGIGGVLFTVTNDGADFRQPEAVLVYQGKQLRVPMRYLFIGGKLYDFKDETSLQSCLYIIPSVSNTGINSGGAALYISEKGMDALWVHLYLLNEGTNFKLVHKEPDVILKSLEDENNITIGDIALYNGNLLGPIKIWEIDYPASMKINPEYLRTTYPDLKLYTG